MCRSMRWNTDMCCDMKIWGFLCVLLCVICLGNGDSFANHTKPGFILTAPKMVDAGGSEYFTFTAFNVAPGGVLTFKLVHWYTNELIAETTASVPPNMNMWVEMQIPPRSSNLKAKLRVMGRFRDGFKIDAEKEVIIRHNSILTFVQTDKPIYKPGQTVRFRVLPMDSQLKPLLEHAVGNVWIEDPSAIRVAQWNDVKFSDGIVQLELPLSNEPPFGEWTIKTVINQVSYAQKFKVEKYVLPKFEVKINPPSFVMADAESLSVEVCAWYTYGKQVDGIMTLLVSYKKYEWERLTGPTVIHSEKISGCRTITMDTQELLLERREFGFRTIEIFTEVTEEGTGIKCNATAHLKISHSALKLKFLSSEDQVDYFKPGIPFYGKLSVSKPDGTPAPSEKIEICAKYSSEDRHTLTSRPWDRGNRVAFPEESESRVCHLFTSNKNGLVHFSIPPKLPNIRRVELQASAVNYEEKTYSEDPWTKQLEVPRTEFSLQPWFSPSDSYLQIQPIANTMDCEKLQRVRVRYTAERGKSIKFYHQVLSRGRIVQQGSHQRTFQPKAEGEVARYDLGSGPESGAPETAEFLLSLDPRPPMAPVARLLVFYVRDDGEVVADARVFRIAHCLKNKVSLHFRHEQQYPNTESTLLLSASPSSLCGISMVDKSVRLLDPEAQFKKKNIFKALESYDVGKKSQPFQVSEDYCLSYMIESDALPDANPVLTSRRLMSWHPSPYLSRYTSSHVDTSMAFEEAGMVAISNFKLETRPCEERIPVAANRRRNFNLNMMTVEDRSGGLDQDFEVSMMVPENNRPEMNKLEPEKPKEDDEVRSYFPETWLWEMHKVGSSGEMALQRPLPHTITQWVGGAVCMHPKTGLGVYEESAITAFQPFFVDFQLPYSVIRGEKLTFTVSVFNYLTECLPIKLSLDPSEEFELLSSSSRSEFLCVCGGRSKTHKFAVRPLRLGEVNITVHGFSLEDDEDILCGNEVTARLKARDAVTKQLKVEAEGFPKIEVFNYFVCPENKSYTTEVDLLLPENVVESSARATVSVSGDIMGPALHGLDSLVKMPVGCGEQNMVLFTPNIFVLEYLTSTGTLTDEIKAKCLDHMKTGYQRELQYRHPDGSYSAFGTHDKQGSLWLTAFVVRSFGQARRFVTVDEGDLNLSTAWLLSKQFENGCFEPVGTLFSDAMKGGLRDNEQSLAPMTAYVLISLLESNLIQPDHFDVQNALRCLATELTPGTYAMALFAYANALAKEPSTANRFLRYLEERAVVRSGHMYWAPSAQMGLSLSGSVEVAGYYILAKLKLGGRENTAELLPVIRWMVHQRNANGGFVSTQDTVVALQAIASFSALQSDSSVPLDMGLVVDNDELVKGFMLTQTNRLVTQSVEVPVLPAVLELQAVGQGCAVLQFSLRYNVEKVSGSDAFALSAEAFRFGKKLCDTPILRICMRYRIPFEQSNMAVVEVRMASGFAPLQESLEMLESEGIEELKRYEVNENKVNFYFETLTNQQNCFRFYMRSESEVEDIKPSMVKLYDYYKPDLEVTKDYSIPSDCIETLPDPPELPYIDAPEISTVDMIEFTRSDQELTTTDYAESGGTTLDGTTAGTDEELTGKTTSILVTSNDVMEETTTSSQPDEDFSDTIDQPDYGGRSDDTLEGNFVNVDMELDFPDSDEENMPVTVLPPETFGTETSGNEEADCPVCKDGFPDNFNEIYCNSAFALRAIVKDPKVKIMHDLSWHLPNNKSIKKLAVLEYNNKCSCSQLKTKGAILILGSPIDLWKSGPDEQSIHLTSAVSIYSTPTKAVMPTEVRTAKISCSEDP